LDTKNRHNAQRFVDILWIRAVTFDALVAFHKDLQKSQAYALSYFYLMNDDLLGVKAVSETVTKHVASITQ
jgi:hypothetical protein